MPTIKVPCLLDIPSDVDVYVDFSTRDGSLQAGIDYMPISGSVLFPAGVKSKEIEVDLIFGSREGYFFVDLRPPTNGRLWKTEAKITLRYPSEANVTIQSMYDDLWGFIVRSTGRNADEAGIPQLTTTEGLVKNNMFVGGALGGYTPDGTASSEGIAIMLRAISQAYEYDNDSAKLEYCNFLMEATVEYFFRGEYPPEAPGTTWNHHWIINAGDPFAVRGPLRYSEVEPEPEYGPVIALSPLTVSFGDVTIGEDSQTRSLTISNNGNAPLEIISHTITGAYRITNIVPTLVEPRSYIRLNIVFKPVSEGPASGVLTLVTNTPSSPQTVTLAGTGALMTGMTYLTADGSTLRDAQGQEVVLKSFNWYGMEGILMPQALFARAYKTVTVNGTVHIGIIDQMASLGFNSIRMPVCEDLTWPNRKIAGPNTISASLNPDLLVVPKNGAATAADLIDSIQILDKIVEHCGSLGMRIVLDMHALALNTDNTVATGGLWYTTPTPGSPGGTNGVSGEQRNEEQWIQAWEFLANRYKNNPVVCGFDLVNEPHNGTWDNNPLTGLPAAYERCAARIHAINPDVLIICGGPGGGVNFPNGKEWWTAWGGNLSEVRNRPVQIARQNKVVYTPHDYANLGAGNGPSWLYEPDFPENLPYAWDHIWGYIAKSGTAPIYLGEFGGNFNDGQTMQKQWIAKLTAYMSDIKQSWAWWALDGSGSDVTGLQGVVKADMLTTNMTVVNALRPLLDTNYTPPDPEEPGNPDPGPAGELGRNGRGIAAIGDSITEGNRVGKNGWLAKMCFFSNQALKFRGEVALGGSQTSHGISTQISRIIAMVPKPKACVVAFGSNHLYTEAVTSGIQDIKTLCQTLVTNDIQPILWTVPPRGDIPSSQGPIEDWNSRLLAYQAEKGYPVVDAWGILKNPNSYSITPTTATYDGTHITSNGASILGQAAAAALATWNIQKDNGVTLVPTATSNILYNNGLFTEVANNIANGFNIDSPLVPSIRSAGVGLGNWQRITMPANAVVSNGTPACRLIIENMTPHIGKTVVIAFKCRSNIGTNAVTGTNTGNTNFQAVASVFFQTTTWAGVPTDAYQFLYQDPGQAEEEGTVYVEVVIPSQADKMTISLGEVGGSHITRSYDQWVEYSQLTVQVIS